MSENVDLSAVADTILIVEKKIFGLYERKRAIQESVAKIGPRQHSLPGTEART